MKIKVTKISGSYTTAKTASWFYSKTLL
jgi:hypothetical protein